MHMRCPLTNDCHSVKKKPMLCLVLDAIGAAAHAPIHLTAGPARKRPKRHVSPSLCPATGPTRESASSRLSPTAVVHVLGIMSNIVST
jgi:hypothetical protein